MNPTPATAKPKWPDLSRRIVVCVATGPSLTVEQIDLARQAQQQRDAFVIAINEAGLRRYLPLAAPWADAIYAADHAWWRHYQPNFYGWRISGEPVNPINLNGHPFPGVYTQPLKMLERDERMPIVPGSVVSGGHSGFQALGFALSCGSRNVILLGYDCGRFGGRNAHDATRPDKFKRDTDMSAWAKVYTLVRRDIPDAKVINCSQVSAISCFDKMTFTEALQWHNESLA